MTEMQKTIATFAHSFKASNLDVFAHSLNLFAPK